MNDRLGGGRVAGVFVLLSVQAALAAFLGFVAYLHSEEAGRYVRYLQMYSLHQNAAALRLVLETCGMIASSIIALVIGTAVILSTIKLSVPNYARQVQRICGWICFVFAFCNVLAAIITPRVGSPHDDMFPGLGHYISAFIAGIAGFTAMGISRVARPAESNVGDRKT
jgi:hypothetical protein